MRKPPPRKKEGKKTGLRRINGQLLDIGGIASFVGLSEKATRARIARGQIPARKFGGRIVALRGELDDWMRSLPRATEVRER